MSAVRPEARAARALLTSTRISAAAHEVGVPMRGPSRGIGDARHSPQRSARGQGEPRTALGGALESLPSQPSSTDSERLVLERTLIFRRLRKPRAPTRRRPVHATLFGAGLTVLLATPWWLPMDTQETWPGVLAAPSKPIAGKSRSADAVDPPAAAAVPPGNDVPSGTGVVSKLPLDMRGPVDLLLSGDTRAALDAYRGALARSGSCPELELAVHLLERELASCRPGEARCAP
jgi:hypothetical protein